MMQRSVMAWPRLACLALATLTAGHASAAAQSAAKSKIPITTSSTKARQDYLKGRTLQENLRAHDSREFLKRAAAEDPGFALAHFTLAVSAPTAKDFFEHVNHAVALADKASEGERLMILGLQAGANGDPAKQRQYYQELVGKYPNDERAHFLLGGSYFGQQEFAKAAEEYRKAVEIAPDYAPAYNLLGYAYRSLEKYPESEAAFKKYIELIPRDPNPYDSYAELLMKMGRFDESIAMYRKALTQDPQFAPSFIGITSNLMFQGKYDAARAEARKLHDAARNDGERRAALFNIALTYADEGRFDWALRELEKEYAVAEGINDAAAMSGDAVAMGDVLLEAGKPDQAMKRYEHALRLVESSDLSNEVKENVRLTHHYNVGRAALRKGDLPGARKSAEAFRAGVTGKGNDAQIRLAHELDGMIALEEKDFDRALAELAQANLQDPYNLYRMGVAHAGKGDQAKAKEMFRKAANFNALPTLNSAFARYHVRKQGEQKV